MTGMQINFLKLFGFLMVATCFGAVLAAATVKTSCPLGWIGAVVLIGWAIIARRRWRKLQQRDGSEPGAPERVVWQRFAGYSVIAGHMAFAMVNPQYDLHVGSGNFLAIDNWTLIIGVLASAMWFRSDSHERDERDDRIDAVATRWGYRSLIGLLAILLTFIGFLPRAFEPIFGNFFVAHTMVSAILASLLLAQVIQLVHYARDGLERR